MDDAQAVDMRESFEDLPEKTPDLLCILIQVPTDEIPQCLKALACTERTKGKSPTRFSQYSIDMYNMVRYGR